MGMARYEWRICPQSLESLNLLMFYIYAWHFSWDCPLYNYFLYLIFTWYMICKEEFLIKGEKIFKSSVNYTDMSVHEGSGSCQLQGIYVHRFLHIKKLLILIIRKRKFLVSLKEKGDGLPYFVKFQIYFMPLMILVFFLNTKLGIPVLTHHV